MDNTIDSCVANYDFKKIVFFAKKKFIDKVPTIELLESAISEKEKEEILLISLLDIEDLEVRKLGINCKDNDKCDVLECRGILKKMIEEELK